MVGIYQACFNMSMNVVYMAELVNRFMISIIILLNMATDRKQRRSPDKEVLATVWESLKGWMTNLSFKMEEFTASPSLIQALTTHPALPDQQTFYIAGTQAKSVQQFKDKMTSLIWHTYRKNVQIAHQAYSDIGWGCLLRVAQMAFANMLLLSSRTRASLNRLEIIRAFTETRRAQYGIINFIEAGHQLWNRRVGDWYSMTEVAMILQALHEKAPLEGTKHLRVAVYNQTVSIDELLQTMASPFQEGSVAKAQENTLSGQQQIPRHKQHLDGGQKDQKEIFLMITTQLNDSQRISNEQQLLRLMELPIFSSCLGGVPQKARFITAKMADRLCYLDPHYAQQAVTQDNLEQELDSFTCPRPRWMKCSELESNIAICFHLKNPSDVLMLMQAIDSMQPKRTAHSLVDYSWSAKVESNPLYFSQEIEPDFQETEGEWGFEVLG